MDTRYTYASTRAKTMETNLLTETQLERLITAKTIEEAFRALGDTFLAHYLPEHEASDVSKALDATIVDAKRALEASAPEPELLHVLWIKYDYYNLKTIIKGRLAGKTDDEILANCFRVGIYAPKRLLKAYDDNALGTIDSNFKAAKDRADARQDIADIDIAMNMYYFESIKRIASDRKNSFIQEFTRLLIDIFNVKSQLRLSGARANGTARAIFVDGGTFTSRDFETEEAALKAFRRVLGRADAADEAAENFRKSGDFSLLEKRLDESVAMYLKEKSIDLYSPAPLFAYFTAQKNNAQVVRTVMVGKQSGLPEHEIRMMLRKLYS